MFFEKLLSLCKDSSSVAMAVGAAETVEYRSESRHSLLIEFWVKATMS